jgi:hypothetical protein
MPPQQDCASADGRCVVWASPILLNRGRSAYRPGQLLLTLVCDLAIPASTPIKAYGKRMPIAPNTTPDGRHDPEGQQKNRRVEIVSETCKS